MLQFFIDFAASTLNIPLVVDSSSLLFQVLQLVWFWMICRVAWRVISGRGAADERSDDDE